MEELQGETQIEESKIKWNQVTWYSQIVAVVLAFVIFIVGFYVGKNSTTSSESNTWETVQNENGKVIDFSQCSNNEVKNDSLQSEQDIWEQCKAKVSDINSLFLFATSSFPISTTVYYQDSTNEELATLDRVVFTDTRAMLLAQRTHQPLVTIDGEQRWSTEWESVYFKLLLDTGDELIFTMPCFKATACRESGIYRYDKTTNTFSTSQVSEYYKPMWMGGVQSPDGTKIATLHPGELNSGDSTGWLYSITSCLNSNVGYIDLIADEYISLTSLPDDKRVSVDCGMGNHPVNMTWLDNETVEFELVEDNQIVDGCNFTNSTETDQYSRECKNNVSTSTMTVRVPNSR